MLPVVFRRDVEVCVKNHEKRRKALWVRVSLRLVRESSFNMTRGGGGGNEDIEGGHRKFLDTRKGGSEKICIL